MSRAKLRARIADGDQERIFMVRGQTAKALDALVQAGPGGVTAQEVSSWAYRFAAYCHDLRRKHGLQIETVREDHNGGWHGRHILHSPVTILPASNDDGERGA